MGKYSVQSWERLQSCHEDIVKVFIEISDYFDVTMLCGYRGEQEQNAAYPKYTNVKYPNSKHNKIPSFAIDAIPYDSIKFVFQS